MLPGLVISGGQNSLSVLLRYIWSQSEDASQVNILVLALQCWEKGNNFFGCLKMKASLPGNSNPTTFISPLRTRLEEMSPVLPWDERSNTLRTRQQIRNCCLKQFLVTVEKPIAKSWLWPITTEANSVINLSEFQAITCNLLKARESRAYNCKMQLILLLIGWKTGAIVKANHNA